MTEFPKIYQIAVEAAIAASHVIMEIYGTDFEPQYKEDLSPVTNADIASSEVILRILQQTSLPITSEEDEHHSFEVRREWVESWCVDPLDGTKEFIKRNGEFAVNIAHIKNNKAIFGIIASPVQQKVLFGGTSTGVFICGFSDFHHRNKWMTIEPSSLNNPLTMTSSRSHHSGPILKIIHELEQRYGTLHHIKRGSALKFFDLALGKADFYPRLAPTMEWDIAAGQAILEALEGTVTHVDTGEALKYNKANLKNPYFIAKTKAFIEENA